VAFRMRDGRSRMHHSVADPNGKLLGQRLLGFLALGEPGKIGKIGGITFHRSHIQSWLVWPSETPVAARIRRCSLASCLAKESVRVPRARTINRSQSPRSSGKEEEISTNEMPWRASSRRS